MELHEEDTQTYYIVIKPTIMASSHCGSPILRSVILFHCLLSQAENFHSDMKTCMLCIAIIGTLL